jgi:hypothetical protein
MPRLFPSKAGIPRFSRTNTAATMIERATISGWKEPNRGASGTA